MWQNLTGWHALIVLAIIFLLFGATKLPALAKSVGQSVKILKSEVEDSEAPPTAEVTPTQQAPVTQTRPHAAAQNGVVS